MIYQRLASSAPAAEKLFSFMLYGFPATFASVWGFGDEVDMTNVLLLTPRAGTPGLVTPEAGNPFLETTG